MRGACLQLLLFVIVGSQLGVACSNAGGARISERGGQSAGTQNLPEGALNIATGRMKWNACTFQCLCKFTAQFMLCV